MEKKIQITWLGHSCFQVKSGGYAAVVDPYRDGSVPGLAPLRAEADLVLCSHEHDDHGAREAVTLRDGGSTPFQVETLDTWHDDRMGELRGRNRIHLLSDGTFRVAHLGDLGCMLSEEELGKLKGVDVLLIPVGGYYTIDAIQAKDLAEAIGPRVTVPMHYRGEDFGYDVIGTLEDFTKLCHDVVYYEGPQLEVTAGTERQTAVLRLQRR